MAHKFHPDPTGHYPHASDDMLRETFGLIPYWVEQANEEQPIKEQLDAAYGYELFEMTGGKVDEQGVYHYPEDPPLHPLLKMTHGDEIVYQYSYGIVAIVQADGDTFVTRMD